MKTISLRQWSTPAIIGSGLFVSVSGVAMFLGVHDPVQEAHEWIGLVFAAAIALHLATHWRGFKNYFSQPIALAIVATVALASSALVFTSADREGQHGMAKLFRNIEGSPLAELAPLLDRSPDQVVATVQSAGFRVEGAEQSIAEIAAANSAQPKALLHLLLD